MGGGGQSPGGAAPGLDDDDGFHRRH
jgi:hypothetical protein